MARSGMWRAWPLGVALLGSLALLAAPAVHGQKKNAEVWTDPDDPTLPVDFKLQGEYVGDIKGGGKLGAQVIALGKGAFQAVLLPGGLPGEGWDGKNKILMDGKLEGDKAAFTPTSGKRLYSPKSKKTEDFSATVKFPPDGQQDCTGTIAGGTLSGKMQDGKSFELKRTLRQSPTLGLTPPPDAIVLFDGTDADAFTRGRLDKVHGTLNTDAEDLWTNRDFNDYAVHCEFMLPFLPNARGQNRGNSGFYQVDRYEAQVLDSFGLDGVKDECGAIYNIAAPKINMCYPPLRWQTYDIDFTNAVVDGGKKIKNPRMTVKLNGVLVQDNVEVTAITTLGRQGPEGTPAPLRFQGHGNVVQYRNIWVVEPR